MHGRCHGLNFEVRKVFWTWESRPIFKNFLWVCYKETFFAPRPPLVFSSTTRLKNPGQNLKETSGNSWTSPLHPSYQAPFLEYFWVPRESTIFRLTGSFTCDLCVTSFLNFISVFTSLSIWLHTEAKSSSPVGSGQYSSAFAQTSFSSQLPLLRLSERGKFLHEPPKIRGHSNNTWDFSDNWSVKWIRKKVSFKA